MRWTALVPVKQEGEAKSRLEVSLSADARAGLARRMTTHVLDALGRCAAITGTAILSPGAHSYPQARWARDHGHGLNPEIADFRRQFGPAPLLVIHADLPLVASEDIAALLTEAERHGAALATDRAGHGTNALALGDGRAFAFRFGPDSRALHCAQHPAMPVVERTGLAADLDTPDDLEFLQAQGFRL